MFRTNKLIRLQKGFHFFSLQLSSFRHCESLSSRHCEERSDEAISPIAPPRHCEPKGRQVCWREAISSLLIPVGVRSSGGIASPDDNQARNDEKEVFARNDVVGLQARNDAPFVIASPSLPVIARSEATKQSPHCSTPSLRTEG
jgi:hypothetical protein